jgi:hypothetical protein
MTVEEKGPYDGMSGVEVERAACDDSSIHT